MHFPESESGVKALALKEDPKNTRFKFRRQGQGNRLATGGSFILSGMSAAKKSPWLKWGNGCQPSVGFLLLSAPFPTPAPWAFVA